MPVAWDTTIATNTTNNCVYPNAWIIEPLMYKSEWPMCYLGDLTVKHFFFQLVWHCLMPSLVRGQDEVCWMMCDALVVRTSCWLA